MEGETEYIVSLTTLNQGAAVELFDAELRKVLENIADPNTEAEAKRKITLEVSFVPDDERRKAGVVVDIKTRLAGHKGTSTQVWFGSSEEGQRIAVEANPQPSLFEKQQHGPRIIKLKKEGGEK